ncbi:MAG: ATP-binding protein [Solobacterium sp.]|nr:ATP-binding protein [Solobacterium sp.]
MMALQRSITESLAQWKNRPHHPLILKGLKKTGKTFSVREFGSQYYKNTVYLDLRNNTSLHKAFKGSFDVNEMIISLSAEKPDTLFLPGETLIILDEIQDCPNARSSLKYWDLDGRFDVIATGSFLGVKGFRQVYSRGIPVGYEEQMTMHPLTFLEFLDNLGMKEDVIAYIRSCIQKKEKILPAVHQSFRKYYFQYLIVGGMPEAVNCFLNTHDMNQVKTVQNSILQSIKDDFGRYFDARGNEKINEVLKRRAEACLESLPEQLSKEYEKFQFSLVNTKGTSVDKANGLQYLCDLGLALKSYNLKEISTPLAAQAINNEFKVFFPDTGLLISQLGQGAAAAILNGDISAYKGAVAENMAAALLANKDQGLFYYRGRSGSPELDFILDDLGVPVIVECKSTNNRATSMKYVLAHPEKYGTHPAVKIADTNIGTGDGFVTYPLYALEFLIRDPEPLLVEPDDPSSLSKLLADISQQ